MVIITEMKSLFCVCFLLLMTSVSIAQIQRVDILVYDSSESQSCQPSLEDGCIRMQVTLNENETTHTWMANSGGAGYRLLTDSTFKFIEGTSTPNFQKRQLGESHGSDYVSRRDRTPLPYLTRITNLDGTGGPIVIYGNDLTNGSTSSYGSISIAVAHMAQLHSWLLEARENGGNGYVTVTVPIQD